MPLKPHLLKVARAFNSAFEFGKQNATLIGGAAACLLGSKRPTRDLDFDLAEQPTSTTLGRLKKLGINITQPRSSRRADRLSGYAPARRDLGVRTAVKIDMAVRPKTALYASKVSGVFVASPGFLLTSKLRTVPERPPKARSKIEGDMKDILFLCKKIDTQEGYDGTVADALRTSLTGEDMAAFWKRADGEKVWTKKERDMIRKVLDKIGFGMP